MASVADDLVDAAMFAMFPGFLYASASKPAVNVPSVAAIEAGLRAMIAQIEADRKARPVHAAIDATHRSFRSDGRPHHYHDPLLDD